MTDNTEHTTTEPTTATEATKATEAAEATTPADQRSLHTTTQHLRHTARHLGHPVMHVAGLLVAHIIAVAVLEKTPLLILLTLH